MLKRILLATALSIGAIAGASAQTAKGEKTLGPRVGYISENSSVLAGLSFRYTFSQHLRISPAIGCAFRNHDRDALLIDVDMHFPFGLSESGRTALYPLAGLTFNSWNRHGRVNDVDVSGHANRFGLNAGAGFDLRCSQSLMLNMEARYCLVKSYSSFIATVGISYIF